MQKSNNHKTRKKAIKSLYRYYDEDAAYYKAETIRAKTKELNLKEIKEQLEDSN